MISYVVVVIYCAARVFAADEGESFSSASATCPAIPLTHTSPKTGQKAWDKCVEYQEQLVYPCERSLFGGWTRADHCHHDPDGISSGAAAAHEFPHQALLGYGEQPDITWWRQCSGALISDRFILTDPLCTYALTNGRVTYAYIGAVGRNETTDPNKLYRIKNIIKHPEFKYSNAYNDMALLETETLVKLGQYVVPACLHVGELGDGTRAALTGWFDTEEIMQKVILTKFKQEDCTPFYSGIVEATQMCFGNSTRDPCTFPYGAPLLIRSTTMHCMHVVAGVTTYGARCELNAPGVFTRVAPYVPWIESVVWP